MRPRLVRACAAALLLAAAAATGASPPAAATAAAPSAECVPLGLVASLPIQLVDVAILPAAPRPHEMLHVSGKARSAVPVCGRDMTLRVSRTPIPTREELHIAALDNEQLSDVVISAKAPVASVMPGIDTPWSVDVPVDDLHLTLGVYRMSIEYRDTDVVPRGRINTFLPYLPAGHWSPTNVAWVWPLVDAPRRTGSSDATSLLKPPAAPGDGSASPAPSPSPSDGVQATAEPATGEVFLDDTLATAFSKGRLAALVSSAAAAAKQHGVTNPLLPPDPSKIPTSAPPPRRPQPKAPVTVEVLPKRPVPVTWAIDPDLLEAARSMAGGYVVRDGKGTRPGSVDGEQAAAAWLAAVTAAVGDGPVFPLPYSDADLVALARAGRSEEVALVMRAGNDADGIFRTVLSTARPVGTIVWPVDGVLTQTALDVLSQVQVSAVLLSEGALPINEPLLRVPTPGMQGPPLRAGGGTVQPLVSDTTLDAMVAADPSAGDVGLAQQRFLSETAMITVEAPANPRDILLLPPRQATNTAWLRRLLALTGQVPWLNGITLDDALRHPVDPTARGPLTYPEAAKSHEVSRSVIVATNGTRARLAMLSSILKSPEVLRPTDRGLLRTFSASWRQDADVAEQVRATAAQAINDWIKKVTIVTTNDTLILLSKSGTIPITVTNGLDQDVQNLTILLRATNNANLQRVQRDSVTVKSHDRQQLTLAANVAVVGSVRFPVSASLLTPHGDVLAVKTLEVHSSGSGGMVLIGTLAMMGLLFLVVAIRLVRRLWTYYRARRLVVTS